MYTHSIHHENICSHQLYILPNTLFYLYTQKTSPDDKSDDKDKSSDDKDKSSDDKDKSSDDKDKSSKSSSSSTGPSGDNDRKWSGDICKAPENWCEGSSADSDDDCDDACDKDSDIRCDKEVRKRLGCDKTSGSGDVAATKKLRRRKA